MMGDRKGPHYTEKPTEDHTFNDPPQSFLRKNQMNMLEIKENRVTLYHDPNAATSEPPNSL